MKKFHLVYCHKKNSVSQKEAPGKNRNASFHLNKRLTDCPKIAFRKVLYNNMNKQ